MEKAPFDATLAQGPATGAAYFVSADDGVRLRVGVWHAPAATKGTILVFQGRCECIEKYGRAAAAFEQRGYATITLDWRGQGGSARLHSDPMLGHVDRFLDYQKDVAALLKVAADLDLPKPWHLIGHSMGGSIGLRALDNGLPVQSCAFTAPMWGIQLSAFQRMMVWPVTALAQVFGKRHSYVPGPKNQRRKSYVLTTDFKDNRLTSSRDMYDYMRDIAMNLPDYRLGAPSMGWLFQALKECRSLSKIAAPDMPCVTYCGTSDPLVRLTSVESRMAHWPLGRLIRIDVSKHDMLSEAPEIRDKVIADVCAFFDLHSAPE